MHTMNLAVVAALAFGALSLTQARAEGMTMGGFEFQNSCATCHGASGKGDGPAAQFFLGGSAPDLTVLQKNNGGVFPVQRIFEVIEGRDDMAIMGHGTREMPMWGQRYMRRAGESGGFDPLSEEQQRLYARTRILSVIEYLSTIQEE